MNTRPSAVEFDERGNGLRMPGQENFVGFAYSSHFSAQYGFLAFLGIAPRALGFGELSLAEMRSRVPEKRPLPKRARLIYIGVPFPDSFNSDAKPVLSNGER